MQPIPQRYLEGCLSDDILPLDPHTLIHSQLLTDSTLNSQAKHISQMANVVHLIVVIKRRRRLMAPLHEGLVLDAHRLGSHQVVPQAARDVQHVLGLASQLLEHVLEALHARLVALRLLRREDGVERRAQLLDIVQNLVVARVRQDDQLVLLGQAAEAFRDVRVRPPGGDGGVEGLGLGGVVGDTGALAGAAQRVEDDVAVGLVGAEDLVDAVAGEEVHEALEGVAGQAVGVDLAGHARHVEVGQRAVAVEGDVFGLEVDCFRHCGCAGVRGSSWWDWRWGLEWEMVL